MEKESNMDFDTAVQEKRQEAIKRYEKELEKYYHLTLMKEN
jgi:hypothetical protein